MKFVPLAGGVNREEPQCLVDDEPAADARETADKAVYSRPAALESLSRDIPRVSFLGSAPLYSPFQPRHWRPALAVAALFVLACGDHETDERPIIGVMQVSSVGPLDEAREGFYQAMADSGFIRDVNITFLERNAQGDIPTLTLIANEFLQQNATHVVAFSSVATQTAMKVITDRPVIFGAVANPYVIGAGTTATSHRPNLTGVEIPLPVDSALALAHRSFPAAQSWGTLFDPADPFAEHYLTMANRTAAQLGIRFVSIACTGPQEIALATKALKAQGVGGIVQIPSVMIGGGFPALVKSARELGMPLVATTAGYEGVPVSLGASFRDNGYAAALILMRVLKGESPATIPFQTVAKPVLEVNPAAATAFGLTLPAELIAQASTVVGDDGANAANAANASAPTTPSAPPSQVMFWFSAAVLGLAFVALAWGVYLASNTLKFPDITPDGSFPLGAAVAATLIIAGVNPFVATLAAMLAGAMAGLVTATLYTRFKVNELLAGILVMTALYSVNLRIMGRSNISLLDRATVASDLKSFIPAASTWPTDVAYGVVFAVLVLLLGATLAWFLHTDFGMALRASGDNPAMISAQGVNQPAMLQLGLALANGLVALSGALVAQYQGFSDVGMGIGSLVAGMASVILGDALRPKRWKLPATIAMVAAGAIVFRALTALALRVGLNPIDLKLATAAFVILTLILPRLGLGKRLGASTR